MIPAKSRRPTMPRILRIATARIATAASVSAPAVVTPVSNAGSSTRPVISPIT
jgi:hypothetical protein